MKSRRSGFKAQLDWLRLSQVMREAGFDGNVIIEHEAPFSRDSAIRNACSSVNGTCRSLSDRGWFEEQSRRDVEEDRTAKVPASRFQF